MIKAEQIPDEAEEGIRRAMHKGGTAKEYIAAALNAWPRKSVAPIPRLRPYKEAETLQHIILPLQETQNAE
jgi:hypothetical protein